MTIVHQVSVKARACMLAALFWQGERREFQLDMRGRIRNCLTPRAMTKYAHRVGSLLYSGSMSVICR